MKVPLRTSESGVLIHPPHWTMDDSRGGDESEGPAAPWSSAHLLGVVPCKAELARRLAAGVLAAVEVHAPGTAKGEGGAAGAGVLALASAGPAATHAHVRHADAFCSGIFLPLQGEVLLHLASVASQGPRPHPSPPSTPFPNVPGQRVRSEPPVLLSPPSLTV